MAGLLGSWPSICKEILHEVLEHVEIPVIKHAEAEVREQGEAQKRVLPTVIPLENIVEHQLNGGLVGQVSFQN